MTERRSAVETLVQHGVVLAIDTEFEGSETLTVQAAMHDSTGRVLIQLYHAPEVSYPQGLEAADSLHGLHRQFFKSFTRRRTKKLSADLSPSQMIIDLKNIVGAKTVSRSDGFRRLKDASSKPKNATWDKSAARWRVPSIRVTMVGHFLPADFARAFGVRFYDGVLDRAADGPKIEISSNRRLAFVGHRAGYDDYEPIVEFLELADGQLFAVRLATVDTNLTFGPKPLDDLAQTLLGVGKRNTFSADELGNMQKTFKKRPHDAFGYGLRDAVLTLLVHEKMGELDRYTYKALGIPDNFVPPMAGTIGGRVSAMTFAAIRNFAASSHELSNERQLKELMRDGGRGRFRRTHEGSRFGEQTGATHGGLLFSRTPTRLWQEAPGMFRDVDLCSCYSAILGQLNLYVGRPVVWEPGDSQRTWTLADVVEFLKEQAADDAWMIWASGHLTSMPNTLVRSTIDGVTTESYRRRSKNRPIDEKSAKFTSRLFSDEVQFGVFTSATWELIELMPSEARREYANLRVDSIVLYPQDFVAKSPAEFDALYRRRNDEKAPWRSELSLREGATIDRNKLDQRYVSLRFPIGVIAKKMEKLRQTARHRWGKNSGQALLWKLQTNTMYGVLASPPMLTNNVVAANQLTSRARVAAYMLCMALNGGQVITDGTWYRRDRIPRCTFRECLSRCPDYPLRQADEDSGIRFYEPSEIPDNDAQFNRWLREHLKTFFQIDDSKLDRLLIHRVEHKLTGGTGSPAFDAIAAVGAGDHVKFVRTEQGLVDAQVCLRGFGKQNRRQLVDWIRDTFSADNMTTLAPIVEARELLKYDEAVKKAQGALRDSSIDQVLFPLGIEHSTAKTFAAIQPSAFVFRTHKQLKTVSRQIEKLKSRVRGSLDVISLRRGHKDRLKGSLSAVLERLFTLIRAGARDLTKALNLREDRLTQAQTALLEARAQDKDARNQKAARQLLRSMTPHRLRTGRVLTGIILRRGDREIRRSLLDLK